MLLYYKGKKTDGKCSQTRGMACYRWVHLLFRTVLKHSLSEPRFKSKKAVDERREKYSKTKFDP